MLQVGYSAGFTKNPTYKEVCSGMTGHNEVVRVVFDPKNITYQDILKVSPKYFHCLIFTFYLIETTLKVLQTEQTQIRQLF